MNPDDYIEGSFDPLQPANLNEIECTPQTELEEQQDWNQELLAKITKAKQQIAEIIEISEHCENTLITNKLKRIKL